MYIKNMFILFDIGGTSTRISASVDRINILEPVKIPTSMDFEKAMKDMSEVVSKISNGQKIEGAAGGVRALAPTKDKLLNQPNYPLWVGLPLHDRLSQILNAPLFLENDAACAALGEASLIDPENKQIIGYLTISTGVGGAKIVKGKIDETFQGFEPGLQIIGDEGTFENYISGEGIEKRYGKKPEEIHDERIWDEIAKHLAVGLNNITVLWSPDIIVLGGSIMKSIPLTNLEYYFKETTTIFPDLPKIQLAQLGDKSGLFGALEVLNSHYS